MTEDRRYFSNVSFLDLLLNFLLVMVVLFALSFLLINPPTKRGDITPKAEYMITVEWDGTRDLDIDSHMLLPDNSRVWFESRERNFVHLDRDDTGHWSDRIVRPDGTVEFLHINLETTTLRGVQEGRYVFNVHWYSKNNEDRPIDVNVRFFKVNPFKMLQNRTIKLVNISDEATAFAFKMNGNGDVYDIDPNFEVLFIPRGAIGSSGR